MKISPIPSAVVPAVNPSGFPQPSRVESIRAMKMTTNATPQMNQMGELPIPANNSQIESTVEATQPLSPQLALLAKQRRALQVKERELADREKAFLSNSTGNPSIDLARLKSEPLSVLLENGVTYDQLTEAIMSGQGQGRSEISALEARLESMEKGIDQKFQDNASAQKQQVLAEMGRDADRMIATNDDFELVRETNSKKKVMELIERTYDQTGEVLEVQEALRLYEEELFKDAQKLARLKKMQSQFAPQAPQPQQRQMGMRTLTNRDTASVPVSARARAMAAFYGTLQR